jgi:choline dehydrogenase-like flavoprotein
MPNRFSLNDGTVAVVIGSGAGGGTLGYELARKGIRTVILEAGPASRRTNISTMKLLHMNS